MKFVVQDRKALCGIAEYADFLRYANAGFVPRFETTELQVLQNRCSWSVRRQSKSRISVSFDVRPSIIGAAKRARYRKYGSATSAFGINALSPRASTRDKSTGSAPSGTHGALAGALHHSLCGTIPAA
jgi:hypothetical protein